MALLSKTAVDAIADLMLELVWRKGNNGVGRARIDKMVSVASTR